MRFHRILSRGALACALAFSLTACDSNDDDNDDDGGSGNAATGTISGSISGNFSGNGYFSNDSEEFAIVLFNGNINAYTENGEFLVFVRENSSRPGQGTYAIDDGATGSDFLAVYKSPGSPGGTSTRFVFGESGEIQITASSASEVRGTYTFTGPSGTITDLSTSPGSSTVSGSFTASFVDPDDFPGDAGDTFTAVAASE